MNVKKYVNTVVASSPEGVALMGLQAVLEGL